MDRTVYQISVNGLIELETLIYQEAKNRMNLLATMDYECKLTLRELDESEY